MSVHLGTLYHWSPKENRESILKRGLEIMSHPTCHGQKFNYLCFGTSPSAAWGLSGDFYDIEEFETWDLWQVQLGKDDSVHMVPTWGPFAQEIRTHNSIPPDRVWWVGERAYGPHITIDE